MDAYERSLKQQADRIRRELSQEGKKGAPAPKPEPKDEFVPSDVPSPIYGYARPKPKINLPIGHSPEARDELSIRQAKRVAQPAQPVEPVATDVSTPPVPAEQEIDVEKAVEEPTAFVEETTIESAETSVDEFEPPAREQLEEIVTEHTEMQSEETIISTETIEESPLVSEDETAEPDTKPLLGEVSILESGFASVFMDSTDLKSSKIAVRQEKQDVDEQDVQLDVQAETVAPIVEDVAKTLQTDEPIEVPDEDELTLAMSVSYKAEGPPLNVMMTPQDRMAVYKSRRLAKKNNNL